MRDISDVMLVAIFSLLSLEFLQGWVGIVTGLIAIPYIIVRLILALRKNNREKEGEKREKEKRKEEHEKSKEDHEKWKLEMELLREELANKKKEIR